MHKLQVNSLVAQGSDVCILVLCPRLGSKCVVNGCTGCICITKANIENKVEGYIKCDKNLLKYI